MMVRVLAGVVGLAIVVPAVAYGGPLAVEIIVAIALLICVDEYGRMAFADDRVVGTAALLASCLAIYVPIVYLDADGALLAAILVTVCAPWVHRL